MTEIKIGEAFKAQLEHRPEGLFFNGQPAAFVTQHNAHRFTVCQHGREQTVLVLGFDELTGIVTLKINGKVVAVETQTRTDRYAKLIGAEKKAAIKVAELRAPMPGLLKKIYVQAGQTIPKGEPLVVLEAMKMENILKAPADVTIAEIAVQQGVAVEKNTVLLKFG